MDDINGRGTKQNPYRIRTFNQLQAARQELDAYYRLISDIDATNAKSGEFKPIGDIDDPFTGTFDGGSYQIANLCIEEPEQEYIGLFGCIGEDGRIENIGLKNATITGEVYLGALVGRNFGTIESSYAIEVDVSGHAFVGRLFGQNYGSIKSSFVQGDVSRDGKDVNLIDGQPLIQSSFVLSKSYDVNVSENADLVISRENYKILYIVDEEANTLYLKLDGEIYSHEEVSPTQVQSLIDDEGEFEITERFKASVVKAGRD